VDRFILLSSFFVLTPIAWLLTKDLRIDTGLKIAAVLFPLFAGGGPFILWLVLNKFGARIFFNLQSGTLQFNGFRFKHIGPIPIGDVIAIQSCYAGFELGTRRGSSSYQKYELNLVLRSGEKIKRINLLCHSVQDKITTQGKAIAKRIRVPFLQGNQEEM